MSGRGINSHNFKLFCLAQTFPWHLSTGSSPGATVHLICDAINVYFLRDEHSFPTDGILTFPQKLDNTASSGGPQQTWEEKEKERRRSRAGGIREKCSFSRCFWLISASWKEEGMELVFLLGRGTDASCSPKAVQRGWQLFSLSHCFFQATLQDYWLSGGGIGDHP